MLLPPDVRDWVPDNHLAHFVIEAVEGMNLRGVKVNHRGTGSEQYPAGMMLSLLIYPQKCINRGTNRRNSQEIRHLFRQVTYKIASATSFTA